MDKYPGHQPLGVVAVLASAAVLTACGLDTPPPGEFEENKRILATCDSSHPPASLVALDGTGSSASAAITKERMAAVESITRTTAVCAGHLRVIVFSSTSASTVTLFDGSLRPHGATETAQLRRVPALVDQTMATIRKGYRPAVADLPGGGSDVVSQYRAGAEWLSQLGGDHRLHLYLLTDGMDNVRIKPGKRALTTKQATAMARKTSVPKLPGAAVTVAGLGRVAKKPPKSTVVEGLVTYYQALCRKTDAARCVAVTDYAEAH